jgi:hypothetical protein
MQIENYAHLMISLPLETFTRQKIDRQGALEREEWDYVVVIK